MSEVQIVNTVIPFVPFVGSGNYLLLMRTAERVQILFEFGENLKNLEVRFIPTRKKKAPNIAEFSPKENSNRFFSSFYIFI